MENWGDCGWKMLARLLHFATYFTIRQNLAKIQKITVKAMFRDRPFPSSIIFDQTSAPTTTTTRPTWLNDHDRKEAKEAKEASKLAIIILSKSGSQACQPIAHSFLTLFALIREKGES